MTFVIHFIIMCIVVKLSFFSQTSITNYMYGGVKLATAKQGLKTIRIFKLETKDHLSSTDLREEVSLMTTQKGIFTSPSYPENYPNNVDCIYIIAQPTYTVFKLNFLSMDIDECTQSSCSSQCPWDYIDIRDGQSESSPLLKQLCGNNTYVGIHNSLHIRSVVNFDINNVTATQKLSSSI